MAVFSPDLASPRTACLQAVLADRVDLVEDCMGQVQVQQLAKYTDYATTPSGVLPRTGLREIVVTETPTLQHVSRGVSTPFRDNGVVWFPHGSYNHIVVGDLVFTSAIEVEQQFFELPGGIKHLNFTPIDHAPLQFTGLDRLQHANQAARDRIEKSLAKATQEVPPFSLALEDTILIVFTLMIIVAALVIYCSPVGGLARDMLAYCWDQARIAVASCLAPRNAQYQAAPARDPSDPMASRGSAEDVSFPAASQHQGVKNLAESLNKFTGSDEQRVDISIATEGGAHTSFHSLRSNARIQGVPLSRCSSASGPRYSSSSARSSNVDQLTPIS